ncbi:unnamed protein product [Dibothriocephalus latus]|uniref:Uncharacterized protein n=1 Tax=Dibothriocephalus latus TaxID=60516 RepID=A0A3P7NZN4_DIBLA|nr:unnamed protein product [Dibothriocephalus latus]
MAEFQNMSQCEYLVHTGTPSSESSLIGHRPRVSYSLESSEKDSSEDFHTKLSELTEGGIVAGPGLSRLGRHLQGSPVDTVTVAPLSELAAPYTDIFSNEGLLLPSPLARFVKRDWISGAPRAHAWQVVRPDGGPGLNYSHNQSGLRYGGSREGSVDSRWQGDNDPYQQQQQQQQQQYLNPASGQSMPLHRGPADRKLGEGKRGTIFSCDRLIEVSTLTCPKRTGYLQSDCWVYP